MNTNRSETNSCELYNDVIFCDTGMKIHTINCDTVVRETNISNSTLLQTDSHSHHFHSIHTTFPQDGDQNGVHPDKNYTFYAFDTLYVHEVDNFQIYINKLNNQYTDVNIVQQDLLSISLLVPKYIQNIPNHKVLTALFDSGGTISLIHELILLPNIVPLTGPTQNFTTLAGDFQSNRQVLLEEIVLPEFKRTSYIDSQQCQVFSGPCCYDIILGRDFLHKIHFHIDFQNNTMTCMDMSVAMRSSEFFTDNTRLQDILFF